MLSLINTVVVFESIIYDDLTAETAIKTIQNGAEAFVNVANDLFAFI
ncbi:MAG: hypothetical protein HRT83_01175 [Hyphomicrobiaceae bacterium]|nr:hypothetical protein [Hyphomicrobiaceae bacterium]